MPTACSACSSCAASWNCCRLPSETQLRPSAARRLVHVIVG
jgi:hypothetical protein